MNVWQIVALCIFVFLGLIWAFSGSRPKQVDSTEYEEDEIVVEARCLLTPCEQDYRTKLLDLVPRHFILHSQVSFNSFLKCKDIGIRNRYNRCVVDFIVTDRDYNPCLIIEVDDPSHNSLKAQQKDQFRDELTLLAGIPTIRIDDGTSVSEIRSLIKRHLYSTW